MQYVSGTPVQGVLFHRLTSQIAASYSGLGPNNIATRPYDLMVGKTFQKPLSGSTTAPATVENHSYR